MLSHTKSLSPSFRYVKQSFFRRLNGDLTPPQSTNTNEDDSCSGDDIEEEGEEVEAGEGDTFDAEIHDAVTQIPAPNKKLKGKIIDVIEKGYKLGDKVIRFPKVVIGQ